MNCAARSVNSANAWRTWKNCWTYFSLSAISAIRETSKQRSMLTAAPLCPARTGCLRLLEKLALAEHWLSGPK